MIQTFSLGHAAVASEFYLMIAFIFKMRHRKHIGRTVISYLKMKKMVQRCIRKIQLSFTLHCVLFYLLTFPDISAPASKSFVQYLHLISYAPLFQVRKPLCSVQSTFFIVFQMLSCVLLPVAFSCMIFACFIRFRFFPVPCLFVIAFLHWPLVYD